LARELLINAPLARTKAAIAAPIATPINKFLNSGDGE
jgi:hypothetical protein